MAQHGSTTGGGVGREAQFKTGAASAVKRGNQASRAASLLHAVANNCQSQSCSSLFGGKEWFPNALLQIRGYSSARIFNDDQKVVVIISRRDRNISPCRS